MKSMALHVAVLFAGTLIVGGCGTSSDPAEPEGIDCASLDQVVYGSGGTSGPCGPNNLLTVHADGQVSTSTVDSYPPTGETECAAADVREHTLEAAEARALLDAACADYNDGPHQEAGECSDGGYASITLKGGGQELAPRVDLHCGGVDMSSARAELRALWDQLPTRKTCEERDEPTCTDHNGCEPLMVGTPCNEPPCADAFGSCATASP